MFACDIEHLRDGKVGPIHAVSQANMTPLYGLERPRNFTSALAFSPVFPGGLRGFVERWNAYDDESLVGVIDVRAKLRLTREA